MKSPTTYHEDVISVDCNGMLNSGQVAVENICYATKNNIIISYSNSLVLNINIKNFCRGLVLERKTTGHTESLECNEINRHVSRFESPIDV